MLCLAEGNISLHEYSANIQFLNTIGDCNLKEGWPGMIVVWSTLFVHTGVMPPVNDIEQICRCPGHKLPRLLNYAIYDKKTCMLHRHLLSVTIT